MALLSSLVAFLDSYLETAAIADTSYNGLQVEGKSDVRRIVFAVDSGISVFDKALAQGADMVIVHHGLHWKYGDPRHVGLLKKRIDLLCADEVSLYASHLPLDRHPVVGNNAVLVRMSGAEIDGEFAWCEGKNVGWRGIFAHPEDREVVATRLREGCESPEARLLAFGPARLKTVAALSGAASYGDIEAAAAAGVELFITGEQRDFYHLAKDLGINVLFLGHNASETGGLRALAPVLETEFAVETLFVNVETGL